MLSPPRGVEVVRRGDVLFLVNHGPSEARLDVPACTSTC
ncbi:Beta-galactosidase C-terminal domain [Saccharothrix sp. ALI-22-I]|nr:Beta-galactosidase C-terminal domain [Saccharothrix sp. ALI-22-I]